MGNIFRNIFNKKMPKKQQKILMLGLDGAGKTTILYSLKLGQITATVPTIGFNVEQLKYQKINFLVWDVGGQEKLRNLWSHYFQGTKGLIYVVDSSDQQRILLSSRQLKRIINNQNMQDCVVLVLANKRDVALMNLQAICQKLCLNQMKRNWAIFPITAIKQKQSGLAEALNWLITNIDFTSNPKKIIKVG